VLAGCGIQALPELLLIAGPGAYHHDCDIGS
jgi:hypothetical protein